MKKISILFRTLVRFERISRKTLPNEWLYGRTIYRERFDEKDQPRFDHYNGYEALSYVLAYMLSIGTRPILLSYRLLMAIKIKEK